MLNRTVTILGVALACTACASFPPPTNSLANSLASVRGAEEIGAENVPKAALQLQLAREELTQAKRLMADGDNELAHSMALRSSNDAELAIVLTREEQARVAATRADQRVETARTPEVTP
jgi:hypothetical protein